MVYLYSGNAPWLQQLSRRNLADVCVAFNRWLAFAGQGVLRKHALQEQRLPPQAVACLATSALEKPTSKDGS